MQKKSALPMLVLLGILLTGLVACYHPVLLRPNTTMMGSSADAIKNYYTPWYHAKWDSTYTWFEGMNYPYGDHVVFADAQPLLSNAIKITGLADYTVGIMNYAMLLSIVLAGWLLYRILLRWGVDALWAAAAGAAIALLSPQILKFNAHYGLAYCFAVPLVWHLALRALERPGFLSSLTLALTVFLLGWLHPYYVMISAVFLTAFWGVHTLVAWRSMKLWPRLMHFSLQVVLPVMLFALVLKLTDPVTDRPSDPYGFDQYMATWKSIFMPLALWGLDRIPQALWKADTINWEGIGYIGVVGGLVFVGYWGRTAYRLILSLLKRKLRQFRWIEGADVDAETGRLISVSMFAGLLVGLFACGIPFAFKPELTTELFPPIKQFRSLGRFSWVFYYTWLTFAFYLLWRIMQHLKTRKLEWPKWVFAAVIGWTLMEGVALNAGVSMRIAEANPPIENADGAEIVLGRPVAAWMGMANRNTFSSLMFLPYFHEGSENFHTVLPADSRLAFQLSIQGGLPMLNVMMSRTSLSQTWSMLQLVTEPCAPLEILAHLPDHRPTYCIRTDCADPLDGLPRPCAGPVSWVGDGWGWYVTDLWASGGIAAEPLPDSLFPIAHNLQASRPDQAAIYLDFEGEEAIAGHRDGSIQGYHNGLGKDVFLKDNNLLHDGPMPFQAGDTVIVSLWVKLRGDRLPLTELGWEEWQGDQKITWHYLSLNNSIRRLDGDWALCEREEVIRDPHNKIQLNVTRWKRYPPQVTVDKLLIRKKGVDVYGFENGLPVWMNNRYLPLTTPPAADAVLGGD